MGTIHETKIFGLNLVMLYYPVNRRFIFLFVLFQNISELASFPHHYRLVLAVNKSPVVHILSPMLADFEEKIEGL